MFKSGPLYIMMFVVMALFMSHAQDGKYIFQPNGWSNVKIGSEWTHSGNYLRKTSTSAIGGQCTLTCADAANGDFELWVETSDNSTDGSHFFINGVEINAINSPNEHWTNWEGYNHVYHKVQSITIENNSFTVTVTAGSPSHTAMIRAFWVKPKTGGYTRHEVTTHDNVGGSNTDLDCIVWVPDGEGPYPVLHLVHGGGYRSGAPSAWNSWAELCKQGYVLFSSRYRLTTEGGHHDTFIEDNMACIKWFSAHASQYKADMDRLALVGSSAGGGITNWLATLGMNPEYVPQYSPYKDEQVHFKACVSYYAAWRAHNGESYIDAQLQNYPERVQTPFLLMHGTADTRVSHQLSIDFDAKLTAAGISSELKLYSGYGHSFAYNIADVPCMRSLNDVLPFLDKHIGPTSNPSGGTAVQKSTKEMGTPTSIEVTPNPFNPLTAITINTPVSVGSNHPIAEIYDVTGRLVETLKSDSRISKAYTYYWSAHDHASGIYLVKVNINNRIISKKIFLVR